MTWEGKVAPGRVQRMVRVLGMEAAPLPPLATAPEAAEEEEEEEEEEKTLPPPSAAEAAAVA